MDFNKERQQETRESETDMSFEIADDLRAKVVEMVRADHDQAEARIIPETNGLVLVKDGTPACRERRDSGEVIMIPVRMRGTIGAVPFDLLFYVCTK